MQQKVANNMRDGFDQIERHYLAGSWVLSEQFSVAGIYLFVVAGWLKSDEVEISEFPKVADHYQRMLTRPGGRQLTIKSIKKGVRALLTPFLFPPLHFLSRL